MAYTETLTDDERIEEVRRLKHVIEDAACDRDWAIFDLHEEFGLPVEEISRVADLRADEIAGIVASIRRDLAIDAAGETERGTAGP